MNTWKITLVCLLSALLAALALGCDQPADPTQPSDLQITTGPQDTAGQDTTTAPEETTAPQDDTTAPEETTGPQADTTGPRGPEDYDNTGENIGTGEGTGMTGETEYERYMNSSAEDQEKFYNSFSSPTEFFAWFNKAKQEYEDSRNTTEVNGDTNVDLGNLGS